MKLQQLSQKQTGSGTTSNDWNKNTGKTTVSLRKNQQNDYTHGGDSYINDIDFVGESYRKSFSHDEEHTQRLND